MVVVFAESNNDYYKFSSLFTFFPTQKNKQIAYQHCRLQKVLNDYFAKSSYSSAMKSMALLSCIHFTMNRNILQCSIFKVLYHPLNRSSLCVCIHNVTLLPAKGKKKDETFFLDAWYLLKSFNPYNFKMMFTFKICQNLNVCNIGVYEKFINILRN